MNKSEKLFLAIYAFIFLACLGCVIIMRQLDRDIQKRIISAKEMNERLDRIQEELKLEK